ncbi:hypothetical protein RvY_00278-2 [Ramazzottius varieornatus]|uniref:Uncharacterized protein n=1 Tax=Ramazzottius varieornatus TaxID=947166 RepID=A0A1D1UD76_RAMVA|nr:hypothetical protein RvY_00278-2 [Ramazzottius varieornatus]
MIPSGPYQPMANTVRIVELVHALIAIYLRLRLPARTLVRGIQTMSSLCLSCYGLSEYCVSTSCRRLLCHNVVLIPFFVERTFLM